MPLKPQQEAEIYPLLDQVLELQVGKAILYDCEPSRANYLTRIIQGLRYDLAVESLVIYDNTDKLYGKGVYGNVWVEPHERGLLLTMLDEPANTIMWKIIQCRATGEPQELHTTISAARQRLLRVKKKYPDIMSALWISGTKIPTVYCKKENKEQLVVDIDVSPVGKMRAPTIEEKLKAKIQ